MNPLAEQAVVARLLAAVGGDAPLTEAVHLLAPDVVCHMDRFTARGADTWVDWVEFIRSRGVEELKVEVERLETGADGIITAFGGLTAGLGRKSAPSGGSARYRVVDGRIVEIWTSRWNYEVDLRPQGSPSTELAARAGEDGPLAPPALETPRIPPARKAH